MKNCYNINPCLVLLLLVCKEGMLAYKMKNGQKQINFLRILLITLFGVIWVVLIIRMITILLPLVSITSSSNDTVFNDLPKGAVNGEWSAMAVAEGHPGLFENIEELTRRAVHVIAVEVLDKRTEAALQRDLYVDHLFTVYTVKVLEVYKGRLKREDIWSIKQIERLEGDSRQKVMQYDNVILRYIRVPISIGDKLILFIDDPWGRSSLLRTVQGIYRYTPAEVRAGHDNWVFESVNEHNNLIFTEADLLRIIENNQ